jgi:antirestriction protein
MMTKFYANPYAYGASGFYFSSAEGYDQKAAKNIHPDTGGLVEEYSFEFIDGSDINSKLWNALVGSEGFFDIEKWFDEIESLDLEDKVKAYWLADNLSITDMDEIIEKVDDVSLFQGSKEDYAHELVDDIGIESISNPDYYFDYEAFGRDLAMDMDEDDESDAYYLSLSNQKRGEEYVDSMGSISELGPEIAKRYFDYDALARDMDIGGDVDEFDVAGTTYTVTNANGI